MFLPKQPWRYSLPIENISGAHGEQDAGIVHGCRRQHRRFCVNRMLIICIVQLSDISRDRQQREMHPATTTLLAQA